MYVSHPGLLDRGLKFTKGGLICKSYLIIHSFFLIFLKILHEKEIILSQRGVRADPLTPSGSATHHSMKSVTK